MYSNPRGVKRPIKDRLGPNPSFSRPHTPSTLDHQSLLKRQRQNNVKWSDSVHGEKNRVSSDGPKCLVAGAVQKNALTNAKGITSHATEIQKKTLGNTQTPTNVRPSESKQRSAIEDKSTEASAIRSASARSGEEKKFVVAEVLTVAAFLQRLGLSKYLVTFQVEEIDMFALKHMNEADLKSIGLPMGPRKKILLALAPAIARK